MAIKYDIRSSFARYTEIITDRQLLNKELWTKCVNVFSSGIDDHDDGWRGEYWGKMMRGACLIFSVNRSEKLYDVLTNAVNGLLSKQEPDGRISSYTTDKEFVGWDMWSRKYVMTGLQHFYDICKDDELKSRIMSALISHADYITDRVGSGKINILETGFFWGGVNSASILEPFVRLYKDTKNEKYLDFARYIISTGGCRDGNLIECALEGKAPFEFPEQKAYETMSFFEGLLAFYEVTGEEKYLDAVCRFAEKMLETDITVIGSCGCTHELFDNSTLRQTEHIDTIMQETCVTVTLIRFLSRIFEITHEKRLTDVIRSASLNALAGALNINGYEQYSMEKKVMMPGLLFDSYSPLCDSKRALGIGGFKQFSDGTHFGCCACIASAGFALYPIMSVREYDGCYYINYIADGVYSFVTSEGNEIGFDINKGRIKILTSEKSVLCRIGISEGDAFTEICASVPGKTAMHKNGYVIFEGEWHDGDEIILDVTDKLEVRHLNKKVSFNYSGFVLAADTSKTDYKPGESYELSFDENGNIKYEICEAEQDEQLRINVITSDGCLSLIDYASAGQDGKSIVSVWFTEK